MRSVDARGGMPARLSRRALLAGTAAATAMPVVVRASEPCPDELEHALSMHHYRLQFQSWSGPARSGGGHVISHCVRSIASGMAFVDWKGPGLSGYVDDSAPLFVQRTYSRAGSPKPPCCGTAAGQSVATRHRHPQDQRLRSTCRIPAFHRRTAMVRRQQRQRRRIKGSARAGGEGRGPQFMREPVVLRDPAEGDRPKPARAGYQRTCTIDTRGNASRALSAPGRLRGRTARFGRRTRAP